MATDGVGPDVLLADDDVEVRRLLALALQKDGCRITEAASGADVFEHLWRRGFDIIISDVRMPGFTGLEVLEVLRGDHCESDLPVIIITAYGDPQLHRDAARLGAYVLEKPFDVDVLRDMVVRLVGD